MKRLLGIVLCCALVLVSMSSMAAEKLSFSQPRMVAGKASLTENGYIITRHLGTANFSPELRLPLDLVYNSASDWTGYPGYGWSIPQLESTAMPQADGVMWTTPWGEKIRFFTKDNPTRQDVSRQKEEIAVNEYYVDHNLEWTTEGQLKRGDWKFIGQRDYKGWELVYKNALLVSVKSPKDNQINIVYLSNRPISIMQDGVKFIEFKYDNQRMSEIIINGISHSLTYETAKITRLPETLAGKVREFNRARLTSIKTGDLIPVEFSYDEQSYLTRIKQGGYEEVLIVENETLEDRQEYLKAANKLVEMRQMGVRAERKLISGRLLQDADYIYTYGGSNPGKVTLTNKLNQKAIFDFNQRTGTLATTDFNGLKNTIYYYMRHDVAYHGKLYQIMDAKQRIAMKYQYDKDTGRRINAKDMIGNELFFNYDKENRLEEVLRQSAGSGSKDLVLKYKYGKNGNPVAISQTDASGKAVLTQNIKYNSKELPEQISNGQQSQFITYNKFGYITAVVNAFGQQNRYELDKFNCLGAVTNSYGVRTEYTYTPAGSVAKIERKDGELVLSSLVVSYDDSGKPASYTDQSGRVKKFERDAFGRVVKELFPDDTKVEYTYSELGQLAQVLDPNEHTIKFDWGKFGLDKRTTAANQLTEYTYDRFGLVKQVDSKFEGQTADRSIKYEYDKFDRVSKITYAAGETETFQYNSWGKLTASSRGDKSATYKYDYFSRLIEKTETGPNSKITSRYEYNAWGQRTLRETVANNITMKEITTYTPFGSIAKIESGNDVVTYEYNHTGQLVRRTANRIPMIYTYTKYGQLESKSLGGMFGGSQAIATLKYIYSPDGQIVAREINGKRQDYKYDPKGQLLEVIGSEKYVYDPAGNILEKTVNGITTTFTYDAANQIVSSNAGGKETLYQYDAAGRLTKEGDKTYAYGYLDKILNVMENGQQIAQFDYHVNGQVASGIYGDKKETFLWDGLALIGRNETRLLNEPAVTGGNPIMANGKPILDDMLGTSLGTLDNGQFQVNELTAFGEPINTSNDNYFTGKPYIGELGYAFLFRNYRSEKGKWQTQDPLGYPDDWNNLSYVNNWVTDCIDWQGTNLHELLDRNSVSGQGHTLPVATWKDDSGTWHASGFDYGGASSGSSSDATIYSSTGTTEDAALTGVIQQADPKGSKYSEMTTWTTTDQQSRNAANSMANEVTKPYDATTHNCLDISKTGRSAAQIPIAEGTEHRPTLAFETRQNAGNSTTKLTNIQNTYKE